MTDYTRYLNWVLTGRCQICGQDTPGGGRQLCTMCEEEINAQLEAEEVA